MRIQSVMVYDFDDLEEERRIKKVFRGDEQKRLLKVLELVRTGKFVEAAEFVDTWGDTQKEYPEEEHLGTSLREIIQTGVRFHALKGQQIPEWDKRMAKEHTEFSIQHG